jgi:hypothetical protein
VKKEVCGGKGLRDISTLCKEQISPGPSNLFSENSFFGPRKKEFAENL